MSRATDPATLPARMDQKRYLAIVYQFGKVASTSLVATLNRIENVEAVQCHFMGRTALAESLQRMVSPDVSDYFFEHQLGQFVQNVRLTRQMEGILAGASGRRLIVISLSRDPNEWFRSSVVQDIEGYLPRFRSLLERLNVPYQDESAMVRLAMTRLMVIYSRILERHGGVDKVVPKLKNDPKSVFAGSAIENDVQCKMFFYMMLRPFSWFKVHFEETLRIQISGMTETFGLLHHANSVGDFFVFRYEDIDTAFPSCLDILGFEEIPEMQRKNVSATKKFAEDVGACFHSNAAKELRRHFQDTEYARRFRYSE